jgi:hypothetical protein
MHTLKLTAGAFVAALIAASAYAGDTAWKPPQEIAPKADSQAQSTPAPAAQPAAPAAAPEKKAEPQTPEARKAKSKDCSAQADAKGLHGKERKKFRDECKKP